MKATKSDMINVSFHNFILLQVSKSMLYCVGKILSLHEVSQTSVCEF